MVRRSYTSKFSVEAARRQAIVNGLVMCEACLKPYPLNDTFQGAIEPWENPETGEVETQTIKVQVGNTLVDGVLEPAYKDRTIPKSTRGRFCVSCSMVAGFHLTGHMAVPKDESAWQSNTHIKGNGFPRERDPDPSWAHNGDPTWIAGARVIFRQRKDGFRSHKGESLDEPDVLVWFDDEPPDTNLGDIQLLRRQVKRVPMLRILPLRTGQAKWSVERLMSAYRDRQIVCPEATIGHWYEIKSDLTKRTETRFIVEPPKVPRKLLNIGGPAPSRNRCKHGIEPLKVYDPKTKDVVYCCTMCAPR